MPQVAIVGGGPVGLGLAVDLGQRGIEVLVLERHRDLHRIPKGQNLTQRTAEHFRVWGILEDVEAARPIPASFGTAGVTAYRNLLSEYSYDWLARSDVQQYYSERNIRVPQYEVERALRVRAEALERVEVRFLSHVDDLTGINGRPELLIRPVQGDAYRVGADYVVGCDGARSLIREKAGISLSVRSHRRRMILAVFRSRQLDDLLSRYPGKSYFNALHPEFGGYWQFLGRVDMQTWFFHAPVPADSTLETTDLAYHLAKAVGREIEFEQQYLGFWDLRIEIADTCRKGNVFIAGDAAHSHPPYGGYGVNTGFEDARNLSWKLEARIRGWGSDRLLDSYTAERQPVYCSTADDFIIRMIEEDRDFLEAYGPDRDPVAFEAAWSERAISTKRDVDEYYPNYRGSPIVVGNGGSPSATGKHSHRALAGCYLPPKDDVVSRLGSRFALVTVGESEAVAMRFIDAAVKLGVPLDIVSMPESRMTREWESSIILVRPDRFIAYAGRDPMVDAEAVLEVATGGMQKDPILS